MHKKTQWKTCFHTHTILHSLFQYFLFSICCSFCNDDDDDRWFSFLFWYLMVLLAAEYHTCASSITTLKKKNLFFMIWRFQCPNRFAVNGTQTTYYYYKKKRKYFRLIQDTFSQKHLFFLSNEQFRIQNNFGHNNYIYRRSFTLWATSGIPNKKHTNANNRT